MKIVAAGIVFGALAWGWGSCNAAEESPSTTLRFEERALAPESHRHESFDTHFRIEGISRISVTLGSLLSYHLDVARYRATDGAPRRAIIHLPDDDAADSPAAGSDPYLFRREAWNDLSRAGARHTDEGAVFVGWWDNMQRLHLHTGRRGRPRYPDAGAYPQPAHRNLWRLVAGGFLPDDSLACLSKHLLREVDEALAGVARCAWSEESGPVFLLLSTDDLAHVQEMSYLAGRGIPLETRLFSSQGDIHGTVASVNAWAGQGTEPAATSFSPRVAFRCAPGE